MARLDFYVNYELQASIRLDATAVGLGRAPDCEVQMPDPKVSRRHAVISFTHNSHTIENFSANGTRVNGSAIDEGQSLQPGDVIFIASYILVYQSDDVPAAALDATVIPLTDD